MYKPVFQTLILLSFLLSCTPKATPPETKTSQAPASPEPLPGSTMSSIPMDPNVRIGKLENGMTYYLKVNQKPENRAELRMAVKTGSMQEDNDQLGLAHFIEHMAFNGTRNFSKNELIDYLESVGTRFGPDLNAYTSFDETVYMIQVRTDQPEQFNKGMLILRDWADGIAFDNAEVDKERGVVISEWRSGLSAEQRMRNEYFPAIYFNSRYANRLPIGDPEIVQNASYDVVKRYYKDWYRPELMSLFVVGNIDLDKTEQQIKDQFSGVVNKTIMRKKESNAIPDHSQTLARLVTDPEATNASIRILYKHSYKSMMSLLDYREGLLNNLYSRMLGRRLSDISKEANPPFIFGFCNYGHDIGDLATYTCFASADARDARRAYQTLLEENQRVLQHGFTEAELEREKANIMRQAEQNVLEESKWESARVVSRLISHFLEQYPIPNTEQTLEMYESMLPTIAISEINQLARKWITDQNRVIVITGPEKDRAVMPDSVDMISIMKAVASKTMEPYKDVDVSAPLLPGTFNPKPVVSHTHDSKLDIHYWQFENGVKVIAKPTPFKNDEILMNAYSKGGHSLYDDSVFPSARSSSSVVSTSGVGTFNAAALEKKLTGIRANVSPFISEQYEGLSGSASVRDAETMMQLVYSYIVKYREDPVALSSYVKKQKASFANLMSNPQNWYSDQVTRITTKNHPRRVFPSLESFDQVQMNEVMRIYQDRFKDVSDMQFFFVGNFDPDSLMKLTSRYLGALPGGGRNEMWKDVGDRYPKGRIDSVFYRGEAPKSLVQFIYHGDDHFHPDTSYIMQSIVELARIKLREELREEEGGVYGVSIFGGQSKYPIEQYSIRINFNADPPRTTELIQAMKQVIEKLKMSVDTADIRKVTETQRQTRIKDLQQNQFWMNAMITNWLNDTDLYTNTQLENLEKRISGLNQEILMKAARKYFREDDLITAVMYPEKKTE